MESLTFHFKNELTLVVLRNEEQVGFGMAVCHPKDNFSRKIGRKAAYGRAYGRYTVGEMLVEVLRRICLINDRREKAYRNHTILHEEEFENEFSSHIRDVINKKWGITSED